MIRSGILFILLAGFSIVLFSCSDHPSSIGADLLGNDYVIVKSLDSFKDSLSQKSSSFEREIPLGSSKLLLLGKKDNVQSSILIRFLVTIPDSIVTAYHKNKVTIVSASVQLYKDYYFGNKTAPFDFLVNKVNSPWESSTVVGNSLDTMMIDPVDISSNRLITDSLTTFNIDPQIASEWIKATADTNQSLNNGILIKPASSTQKILGYESVNFISGITPRAKVVIKLNNSVLDTLNFIVAQDASVSKGTLPVVPKGDMVVQGGLIVNSKLWFDVSKIPHNAIINSAKLTLTIDSLNTITGSTYYNALTASALVDSSLPDSTNSATKQLARSNNVFTGDITPFVHQWIKSGNNQGMLISGDSERDGFELFALRGSNFSDVALRPRLQIVYTIKK